MNSTEGRLVYLLAQEGVLDRRLGGIIQGILECDPLNSTVEEIFAELNSWRGRTGELFAKFFSAIRDTGLFDPTKAVDYLDDFWMQFGAGNWFGMGSSLVWGMVNMRVWDGRTLPDEAEDPDAYQDALCEIREELSAEVAITLLATARIR